MELWIDVAQYNWNSRDDEIGLMAAKLKAHFAPEKQVWDELSAD